MNKISVIGLGAMGRALYDALGAAQAITGLLDSERG